MSSDVSDLMVPVESANILRTRDVTVAAPRHQFASQAARASRVALFSLGGFAAMTGCGGDDGASADTAASSATSGTGADGDSDGDGSSGGAQSSYVPCERSLRAGGFVVQLEEEYTQVEGQVFDVVNPNLKTELDSAEGCQLLTSENYFCDPACGSSSVCAVGEVCREKAVAVSVGEITVAGLSAEVTMAPNVTNFYLNLEPLPHPGFDAASQIDVTAEGEDGGGFDLHAYGSDALEILNETITVARDLPVSIQWVAPADALNTRLHIELDIGHHGGSPATIVCEVEDNGTFEIPATLVNGLYDFGVAGFPEISITRQSIDSVMVGDRCVDLVVAPFAAKLAVEIDGVTSCNGNEDCPDGMTCQGDLSCG
ncbi:MAG: hypothetical protein JKY37_17865 [Nannocystaceae bacterium]|nr:hypothetical protein [Nannocystaceae bacterium]